MPPKHLLAIMRHGHRLDEDATATIPDPADTPLSRTGKIDSQAAITHLLSSLPSVDDGFKIIRLVVSPFLRTCETAQAAILAILAHYPNPITRPRLMVTVDNRWGEIFGPIRITHATVAPQLSQGRSELSTFLTEHKLDCFQEDHDKTLPDWGETAEQAYERFNETFKTLLKTTPADRSSLTLVMTHGDALSAINRTFFAQNKTVIEAPFNAYWLFEVDASAAPGWFDCRKHQTTNSRYLPVVIIDEDAPPQAEEKVYCFQIAESPSPLKSIKYPRTPLKPRDSSPDGPRSLPRVRDYVPRETAAAAGPSNSLIGAGWGDKFAQTIKQALDQKQALVQANAHIRELKQNLSDKRRQLNIAAAENQSLTAELATVRNELSSTRAILDAQIAEQQSNPALTLQPTRDPLMQAEPKPPAAKRSVTFYAMVSSISIALVSFITLAFVCLLTPGILPGLALALPFLLSMTTTAGAFAAAGLIASIPFALGLCFLCIELKLSARAQHTQPLASPIPPPANPLRELRGRQPVPMSTLPPMQPLLAQEEPVSTLDIPANGIAQPRSPSSR